MNFKTLLFDTVDSTNTEALALARSGADEGLCVVAREQTAGRGRYGRSWVSNKDAGLFLSIVLRPKFAAQYFPLITLMTGVAVHDALAELGLKSDIKWVNDIHIDGRKICGILAETAETDSGVAVIVGIGVNLNSDSFPPFLAASSTSLVDELKRPVDRDELIKTVTRQMGHFYEILSSANGPEEIVDHWRQRSSYYSGKSVRVVLEKETIFGKTAGLEANGALRIEKSDGTLMTVQAGDVEQLRSTD